MALSVETTPIPGLLNGWKTVPTQGDKTHSAVWLPEKPLTLAAGRLVPK